VTPPVTPPTDGTTPTTTPSTPPAVTPPSTEKKPDDKPADKPVVPETYDFKAPDNYTLDPKLLETVTPIFKELGLTNEQAQKLVDIQIGREIANAKAPQDAYAATRTEWQTKTKADPEMSAYGFDNVKTDIGKVITALPADLQPAFREAMDITGAGDHPAFVKAMWKLASLVTEGSHVSGRGPSPQGQRAPGTNDKPSPAQAMYPKLA
jgi:hypothetical protein